MAAWLADGLRFGTWLYRGLMLNTFGKLKKKSALCCLMRLGHPTDPQFRAWGPTRCRSLGYQIKICFKDFLLFRFYLLFAHFLLDNNFLEIEIVHLLLWQKKYLANASCSARRRSTIYDLISFPLICGHSEMFLFPNLQFIHVRFLYFYTWRMMKALFINVTA